MAIDDGVRVKIFDAQIRSGSRGDDELRNLQYFETDSVVTTAYAARKFITAADLMGFFEELLGSEVQRLRTLGLRPHVALGLLPETRPTRTHYEVWRDLPLLLQRETVVACGEIGVWEDRKDQWELFERQALLAMELNLPIIVTPPAGLKVNMTYKMMARLEKLGFPPDRALMNHLDERLAEQVVQEGFVAGISVGPAFVAPQMAAKMVEQLLEPNQTASRIVLNSSLHGGASDVLALPKTVVALSELGVARNLIERVVHDNARQFYQCPEASSNALPDG